MKRSWWLALAVCVVIIPSAFSYASPGGYWANLIFGAGFTNEADPGSFYVISAHELVNEMGRPLFLGHPGIPLQVALFAVQRAYYAVAGGGATFAEFIARHLETVYFLSKTLMSIFSLASIWMVFLLSRRLGLQQYGATAAALAYATCFPFVFYVSRISVESQAVFFAFGALLCLFAAEDSHGPLRRRNSIAWMALGGVACALAMLSKMNQTAILIAVLPLGIAISNASPRLKAQWLALFVAGIAVVLLAASFVMDWPHFFGTWSTPGINPTANVSRADAVKQIAGKLWSVFADLPASLGKLALRPQAGFNGMFNLLESVFVISGLAAGVIHVRRHGLSRRLLLLVMFVAWTLFMWWYRGTTVFLLAFHYLFFFMALMAIFFGSALESIAGTLSAKNLPRWSTWLMAVALFAVHSPSLWAFVDTRLQDITGYHRLSRPMFALERQLPAGARAAILLSDADFGVVSAYQGLDFSYVVGKTSNLQAALPMTGILVTTRTRESLITALAPYDYVVDLIQGAEPAAIASARLEPKADWIAAARPLKRIGALPPVRVTCENRCALPDGAGPEFSYTHAFDGNLGTAWYSYPSPSSHTVTIDIVLPGPSMVHSVRVVNGPYDGLFASGLQLFVTRDGQTQEAVTHVPIAATPAGAAHELTMAPQVAERLRLLVTTSKHPLAAGYQFSIAEITVRGYSQQ